MSASQSLPFIAELLSLNDPITRKEKASQMCSSWATVRVFNGLPSGFYYVGNRRNCGLGQHQNFIACVFGEFFISWVKYSEKGYNFGAMYAEARKTTKNGIEILHAQPKTLPFIFESIDAITVAELKEACKKNGLKTTGNKKTLIRALMKL